MKVLARIGGSVAAAALLGGALVTATPAPEAQAWTCYSNKSATKTRSSGAVMCDGGSNSYVVYMQCVGTGGRVVWHVYGGPTAKPGYWSKDSTTRTCVGAGQEPRVYNGSPYKRSV